MKVKDVFKVGKCDIGWVSDKFLEKFGEMEFKKGTVLTSKKLARDMSDKEIKSEYGIQECSLGDILATMGTATDDMGDGYSNIFYVAGFAVYVRWSSDFQGWNVYVWKLGGNQWIQGDRVFSSNFEPLPSSDLGIQSLELRVERLEKWAKAFPELLKP